MWPSTFISLVVSTTDPQEITSLFLKLLMILYLFLAHMSSILKNYLVVITSLVGSLFPVTLNYLKCDLKKCPFGMNC